MRTPSIVFGADKAHRWNQGAYEVWILRASASSSQGLTEAHANEAVLWVKRGGEFGRRQNKVITYLEGSVHIDYRRAGFPYQVTDSAWLGEFMSMLPIEVRVQEPEPEPTAEAAGLSIMRWRSAIRSPTVSCIARQFAQFDGGVQQVDPVPGGTRRLRAFPRSAVKVQAQWFPSPGRRRMDRRDHVGREPDHRRPAKASARSTSRPTAW